MRKKNYKGRCEKQTLEKFTTICKTYDPIQSAYANILVKNKDVAEVRCNVPLDGDECGEYMTDFVCKKTDRTLDDFDQTYTVFQNINRLQSLEITISMVGKMITFLFSIPPCGLFLVQN